MELRNGLAALIGVLMMASPWWVVAAIDHYAIMTALLIGLLQMIGSLLARPGRGWYSWPNWLSLLCGVATIVFPLAFHFDFLLFLIFAFIGYATVMLNFSVMNKQ